MNSNGFYLVLLPPAIYVISLVTSIQLTEYRFLIWSLVIFTFVLVPLLDHLIGTTKANPNEHPERATALKRLPIAIWPIHSVCLVLAIWAIHNVPWTTLGLIGLIYSIGILGATLAINVGHELIHKNSKLEQTVGGLLLSAVCYGGFKIEHVRGHHVNVSTPLDPSTAQFGQHVYGFVPTAIYHNVTQAWKLEAKRLEKLGYSGYGIKNEMWQWTLASLTWGIVAFALAGMAGIAFFLLQALIAISYLEIINYIEHYGLQRKQNESGKFERVTPLHSWNSNHKVTNWLLFNLQRHADHHANPKRPYEQLRHFDQSPQLPSGYSTMIWLALIPPLWFRVMNPKVRAVWDQPLHETKKGN